jgi:glutathione S-transferase
MAPPSLHEPYRVFGMSASGNCHKVRMALDLLGLPYRWDEIDTMQGQTRTPQFLEMNPNGQVPVLGIGADTFLTESGAILCYLCEGSDLWPSEPIARARVLQWMFFEQYSHEPYIAVARFVQALLKQIDDPRLPELHRRGHRALNVMEHHLAGADFFVGPRLTIADLALFAYTHRADEGGFDLTPYPAIRAWLARCERQPGVTLMPRCGSGTEASIPPGRPRP